MENINKARAKAQTHPASTDPKPSPLADTPAYRQVSADNPMPISLSSLDSSALRSQLGADPEFNNFKTYLDTLEHGPERDKIIQNYLDTSKEQGTGVSLGDFMSLMRRIGSPSLKEGYALERMRVEPNMQLKTFQAFFIHLSSQEAEDKGLKLLNEWQPLKTMDEALKRRTISTFLAGVDKIKQNGPDQSHIRNANLLQELKDNIEGIGAGSMSLLTFLQTFTQLSHIFYKKEALACFKNWSGFKNLPEDRKVSTLKVLLGKIKAEDTAVLGPYMIKLMVDKAETEGNAVSQKGIVDLVKGFLKQKGFTAAAYLSCEKYITLAHHQDTLRKDLFETCFPQWENDKIESFLILMDLNTREYRSRYLK